MHSRKPIENLIADSERPEFRLKRQLGRVSLVAMGVGAAIGSGIYVAPGMAAAGESYQLHDGLHQTVFDALKRLFLGGPLVHFAPAAGPAITVSLLATGGICLMIGLCYAELASLMPVSGSVYSYVYAAIGELAAWLTGWVLMLEYGLANVAVAAGLSNLLRLRLAAFHVLLPDRWSLPVWAEGKWTGSYFDAPAFLIMMVVTLVLAFGIRAFSWANTLIVIVKVGAILLFVAAGMIWVQPGNWRPFAPGGMAGVFTAGIFLFYLYVGFDCVSVAAEEAKHPERDLPAGFLGSVVVSGILYVAAAIVMLGMMHYTAFREGFAASDAVFARLGSGVGNSITFAGIFLGLISSLLVFQYGQIRIWYAMSRDGFLPKIFSLVHPKTRVPHWCTWIGGCGVALCAGLIDPGESTEVANLGSIAAFALVAVCVLRLRKLEPKRPRPFRVRWLPWLALMAFAAVVIVATGVLMITWIRFGLWLSIGLIVYLIYGRRQILRLRRAGYYTSAKQSSYISDEHIRDERLR